MDKKNISRLVLLVGLMGLFLLAGRVSAGEKCWDYYNYSANNLPNECLSALGTGYENPYSCTAQAFPEELKAQACPEGGNFPSIVGYYCTDTRRPCISNYYKPSGSFYCMRADVAGTSGFVTGTTAACDGRAIEFYRDHPRYAPPGYAPNLYCCAYQTVAAPVKQSVFARFKNLWSSFGKKVGNVFTGGTKPVEVKKAIKRASADQRSKNGQTDNQPTSATVRVHAKDHAWGPSSEGRQLLDTGLVLREGDTLIISVDPNQKWSIGPGDKYSCNANGCSGLGDTIPKTGSLSFTYGSLVGYLNGGVINGQGFFKVGTDFKEIVGERLAGGDGKLYLIAWDDFPSDNSGYLDVTIDITRADNKPKIIDDQDAVATPKSNSDQKSTNKKSTEKSTEFEKGWELINNSKKQLEQMKNLPINGVSGKITDDLYVELIVRATQEAQKDPNGYILTMRNVYAKYGITEMDLANYSRELAKDPARAQALMAKYTQAMTKSP